MTVWSFTIFKIASYNMMPKLNFEIIATLIIGFWIVYIQYIYLSVMVIPGWNSTVLPNYFMNLKLIFIVFSALFFIYRIWDLYKKGDSQ